MIIDGNFSPNELLFINELNDAFFCKISNKITVIDRCGFVRFTAKTEYDDIILQFKVRDVEESSEDYIEGEVSFVHISNILIPREFSNRNFSLLIIFIMLVTCQKLNLCFFITGIVNERWIDGLIKHGGIVDKDGDIEITLAWFLEHTDMRSVALKSRLSY